MGRVRTHKTTLYAEWIGYKCANPECNSGYNIEIHHILPSKSGGTDEYWNFISLCRDCHRRLKLHSKHKDWDIELFTYKCNQELELWGFFLDEKDPKYYENLRKLITRKKVDEPA